MTRMLLIVMACAVPLPARAQDSERMYREACDAGDLLACNVFGLMYEAGEGVPRDLTRAAALYLRACDGGVAAGCANLAILYEGGAGMERSVARAVDLHRRGCMGGEALSCERLGQLGQPVPSGGVSKVGHVSDAETGRPLDQAVVELPDLGVRELSDSGGRIELRGIPMGVHRLRAQRVGYETVEGELEMPGPAFAVLLRRIETVDLGAPGRIAGRVLDESGGRGVASVEVTVGGATPASTLTDSNGRFLVEDLEPGPVDVHFTRLGYGARSASVVVQPDQTVEISASMSERAVELEGIEVSVRPRYLERSGFYAREWSGFGTQFTPEELEQIELFTVTELLWRVPGIAVQRDETGRARPVARGRDTLTGPCFLSVYLDGVLMSSEDLDDIPPDWLFAAEFYRGLSTPLQFRANACGAVVLWSKR